LQLQATALTASGRACLLIERLDEAYAATVSVLQKARETVIALQRLDGEIQKKEILVHCLAEDLSAALGNVVTSLRLIELEENTPRTLQLLGLALRGAQEQQNLINKALDLFSDELGGLYGRGDGTSTEADLPRVLQLVSENVSPAYSEKDVRLLMPDHGSVGVSAEASRVGRVVANLLMNALENTPSGAEVAVRILEEGDAVIVAVDYSGDVSHGFDPARALSPEAALRLQFCRIAVESCQGEIGFKAGEGRGACVWVRFPKNEAAR
jgi:signal transduction histidine kinase